MKNKGKAIWRSKNWKKNKANLIAQKEKCERCGSIENLTPAHPKSRNYLDVCVEYYRGMKCPNCSRKRLYYRQTLKPHLICGYCKEPAKEEKEKIKKMMKDEYVSMKTCILLCRDCHYKTMKSQKIYYEVFELPKILKEQEKEEKEWGEENKIANEAEEKIYPTKKELEKLYNREKGYYDSYCWFEDAICNICGKLMHGGGEEYMAQEQYFEEDATFCSTCAKLPDKIKLIKRYCDSFCELGRME